jgi:catalase
VSIITSLVHLINNPFPKHLGVRNYQRDGPMNVDGNQSGAPNYFPNSFKGPEMSPDAQWHAYKATG